MNAMESAHTFDGAEIGSWRQTITPTVLVADARMTTACTDRIIPCPETDLCLTQEQSLQPVKDVGVFLNFLLPKSLRLTTP
jgi:hypothetical protein